MTSKRFRSAEIISPTSPACHSWANLSDSIDMLLRRMSATYTAEDDMLINAEQLRKNEMAKRSEPLLYFFMKHIKQSTHAAI